MTNSRLPSSFRDPDGYIYKEGEEIFRRVTPQGKASYVDAKSSGLFNVLWEKNFLVQHEELFNDHNGLILKPELLPFISYPYEWSFNQLKDAALLTLKIQNIALKHGMSLKDASAYNIQFVGGKPIFIDTLSFEKYSEGKPWVGYKQFCQHFLAPLAMASYNGVDWLKSLRVHLDGFPLSLASNSLPTKSKLNTGLLMHLHWHAKSQNRYADDTESQKESKPLKKSNLLNLLKNLYNTTKKLNWKGSNTEWGDYYNNTNYTEDSFQHKVELVGEYIEEIKPARVWDLGANDGTFSKIAADKNIPTVAFDIDHTAVALNYERVKNAQDTGMLPLVLDLTNPSTTIGWAQQERDGLQERASGNSLVMALALIHHISISNNVPLEMVAKYLQNLGEYLIIEFVPKSDSKVKKLLATRVDIFSKYNIEHFELAFGQYFTLVKKDRISNSDRTLYLFKSK